MTTFLTMSGSVYETDEPNRMIRQLARNASQGGSRRLADGAWVDYLHVQHQGPGSRLWIWLGEDNPIVTSELVDVIGCSISD